MKQVPSIRIGLVAGLCLLTLAPRAYGDGISLQHAALPDLIDESKVAWLVRVDAFDPKTMVLKAKVKRVWSRTKARLSVSAKQVSFVLPAEEQMIPGRWIIVRRYWDTPVSDSAHDPGRELVLIPSFDGPESPIGTVISASPYLTYKLELLFRTNWKATYRKRATVAALTRDLADFDLYKPAYATLKARGRLRNADLIRAASKAPIHDLVAYHLERLPKTRTAAFLQDIVNHLKKSHSPRLERLLVGHFRKEVLRREELGALRAFLEVAVHRASADDIELMHDLNNSLIRHLRATKSARDADKFIAYFARYTRLRPGHGGADEHVTRFVRLLTPKGRTALCLALMGELAPAKNGKFDHLGFTVIMNNQDRIPAARLIRFLAWIQPRVDPESFHGCDQVSALVQSIVRLGDKHPSRRKQLAPLARAVLPQYDCNVDSKLRSRLTEIERP